MVICLSQKSQEACFSTIATGNQKNYACFIVITNLAENLQVKNYIHYLLIGKIFFYGLCLFRMWMIMALYKFLPFVAITINNVCLLSIPPVPVLPSIYTSFLFPFATLTFNNKRWFILLTIWKELLKMEIIGSNFAYQILFNYRKIVTFDLNNKH